MGEPVVPSVYTILVVDDAPALRQMLGTMLKQQGFRVLEAETGAQALAYCAQTEQPIDLLLVDLLLPGGLSGVEVVTQARALRPGLPAIVLSGYGPEDVATRSTMPADLPWLTKPFRYADLLARLAEVWGASALPRAVPRAPAAT